MLLTLSGVEKAASYAFLADRTLSNNNISLLNDYNQYQLAIINSPTTVQFSNANTLYNVKSGKVSSCGLVGESILLTSNVKQKWGSGSELWNLIQLEHQHYR